MDIGFPEGQGPVVFEVSPTFDLNPEPPEEWAKRPYREYKATEDYKRRRAEAYTGCAMRIISYALQRRGKLFVDVDNTVSASWESIRRAAVPSWPGVTFDVSRAFSPSELALDAPLPGAAWALAAATRDWDVSFLTARGFLGAFGATAEWLRKHGFAYNRLIVVNEARDKAAWLEEELLESPGQQFLLIDDLSRNHHKAEPVPDEETIGLLKHRGIPFEVFVPGVTKWADLVQRLHAIASTPAQAAPAPHVALAALRTRCDTWATLRPKVA